MPSAKRPVRKSSSAVKPKKVASPVKSRAGRTTSGKGGRKPAAVKATRVKPAPAKKAAKAKVAASKPVRKSTLKSAVTRPTAAKGGKPAINKAVAASQPTKAGATKPQAVKPQAAKPQAAKPQAPVLREMVVRTTPGLAKASGRNSSRPSHNGTRQAPDRYDPDALIHGIKPYRAQPGEAYMNPAQLEHFRQILLAWRRELMEEVDRTVHHMQDEASNFPDPNDRATQESEFGLELRTRDRERKLLKKIDGALERIGDRAYGYCEETGEEIGLKRLEARPVATLCLEAQERRELAEKQYGEREDQYR
jgi:DnaK suppressor protein